MKKITSLLTTCIFCFIFSLAIAKNLTFAGVSSVNLDDCDYDDIFTGNASDFAINDSAYSIEIDGNGGVGFIIEGVVNDELYNQINFVKNATQENKPNSQALEEVKKMEGNIALLTSMDEAICASAFNIDKLFIRPMLTEKKKHYVVGVCMPETDHCWKLKIRKYSQLGSQIKRNNGVLDAEGQVVNVYYLPNKEIFSIVMP